MQVRVLHRSFLSKISSAREVQTDELLTSNQVAAGSSPVARSKFCGYSQVGLRRRIANPLIVGSIPTACFFSHRRSQTAKALVLETGFCEFDSRRRYIPKKFRADDVKGSIEVLQTSRKSSNLFQSINFHFFSEDECKAGEQSVFQADPNGFESRRPYSVWRCDEIGSRNCLLNIRVKNARAGSSPVVSANSIFDFRLPICDLFFNQKSKIQNPKFSCGL